MLKFYLTTIIIWYIILLSTIKITKQAINKNGRCDLSKTKLIGPLFICTIPIFRVLVIIGLFILAFNKKEGAE